MVFILIVLLAGSPEALAQLSVNNTNVIAPYRVAPSGSARSMAMGGAYTGVSDDLSALVYNPAGMVFGHWTFDVNVENSRLKDREVPSTTQRGDLSQASDFLQGGIGFRPTKWLAVAAGLSNPYQLNLKDGFNTSEASINLVSAEAAVAIRFNKIALGIGYHHEELTSSYRHESYDIDAEEKATSGYIRAGVMLRGKKTSLGISYTSAREYEIDQAENANIPIGSWFRDAKVPSKTSLGLAHSLNKKLLFAIDFDVYGSVENAIYPGSGESMFNYESLFVTEESISILHGGLEYLLLDNKSTSVSLRGGYYREPSRLVLGEDRNHFTYGAEVRLGPAKLTVSFDQAPDYFNTSQGFSLVLGSI